jgi:predicted acyl esterase
LSFFPSSPLFRSAGDTYPSAVPTKNWFWETPDQLAGPEGELWQKQTYPDQTYYASDPIGSASMPAGPDGNFVVNGPILMNLWASMAGTDTDFFVSVSDVYPSDHPTNPGWVSYVQRGWLKASHRAVDDTRSYTAWDPDSGKDILVQPYMTHTNPQPVVPGDAVEYKLEIFPLGHIFRPGHRILIQIHTPPAVDGLWGYTPSHQPAAVTILHDAAHPTWIQWPQITLPADQPAPTSVDGNPGSLMVAFAGCKVPGGFPCVPPSQLDLEF